MSFTTRAGAAALALFASGAPQQQAQLKIAYVDTEALMDAAPKKAAVDSTLMKAQADYKGKIDKYQDSLNTLATSYQKDEAKMTAAEKDKRQRAIEDLRLEAQAKALEYQQ